jgi:hypothetical protein
MIKTPYIPIQLEDTGFVSSSSNTKPGAAFRHPCRSRHSVHPERPVFKGGNVFFPFNSIGYTARPPTHPAIFCGTIP